MLPVAVAALCLLSFCATAGALPLQVLLSWQIVHGCCCHTCSSCWWYCSCSCSCAFSCFSRTTSLQVASQHYITLLKAGGSCLVSSRFFLPTGSQKAERRFNMMSQRHAYSCRPAHEPGMLQELLSTRSISILAVRVACSATLQYLSMVAGTVSNSRPCP